MPLPILISDKCLLSLCVLVFLAVCEDECEANPAAEVIYDDVPCEDPLSPDEGQSL